MLVYLPLEKIDMRYTCHLDRDIKTYLKNIYNQPYKIIESNIDNTIIKNGSFLDAPTTIYNKSYQLMKLAEMYQNNELSNDDIVFTTDLWFPGIESIGYLNYFTDTNVKLRGVIHAGSFTDTDFVRNLERWSKGIEEAIFDISDKIFVASNFIKKDILQKRYVNENKLIVTGLPLDFEDMNPYTTDKKENWVVFNGRNVDEKQPHLFDLLENKLPSYKFFNTHSLNLSKKDYYYLLSKSKIVVSFALQENFGYGIMEAVYLKNIPVVPNRLVYTEQYDNMFRYEDFEHCVDLVDYYINNYDKKLQYIPNLDNNNNLIFEKWFS